MTALAAAALLGFGPLSSYVDETGKTVTPFLDNIILIITFIFFVPECFTDMLWVSSENSAIWSELCPSKSVQWDMRLFDVLQL